MGNDYYYSQGEWARLGLGIVPPERNLANQPALQPIFTEPACPVAATAAPAHDHTPARRYTRRDWDQNVGYGTPPGGFVDDTIDATRIDYSAFDSPYPAPKR